MLHRKFHYTFSQSANRSRPSTLSTTLLAPRSKPVSSSKTCVTCKSEMVDRVYGLPLKEGSSWEICGWPRVQGCCVLLPVGFPPAVVINGVLAAFMDSREYWGGWRRRRKTPHGLVSQSVHISCSSNASNDNVASSKENLELAAIIGSEQAPSLCWRPSQWQNHQKSCEVVEHEAFSKYTLQLQQCEIKFIPKM